MIAWPNIHEHSEKEKAINKIEDETERANQLINILDVVVNYVSSVEGRVQSMVSDDPDSGKTKEEDHLEMDYDEGSIMLWNMTNTCIGEGKLQMDSSKRPIYTGGTVGDF
jgi:hypothetical protein